jgi:hypothetical protein
MKVMKGLKPVPEVGKTRRVASRRLILVGLLAPLLLTAAASGQSAWPPPIPKFIQPAPSAPEAAPARQARPQDLAKLHFNLQKSARPPASAFALQTNLRKYLDTWPTPGATATDDWPEYVGESDQELD